MKKREEINNRLVDWIVNKVKTEYADDISLVLIYGSYTNGTANSKSDVDCYYIPKTERGYNLGMCFMIDGVGYDIFPISWQRIERIANLEESLSPLVGDVRIIYCNSTADEKQFRTLQEKMKNNLWNNEYVKNIAQRRCDEACKLCSILKQKNSMSEVRKIAGNIIMTLADAVAVYNHDYYHFGLKKQFENLQNNFPNVPQNIVDGYKNVIEAILIDDVKNYTMNLFDDVCKYIGITCKPQEMAVTEPLITDKVNASWLAELYEEISSTFNKIYVCCENENYILAFLSAVCLQRDLDDSQEAGCPTYDLLSGFNYKELSKFSELTKSVEDDFVQLIIRNGGHIKKYDNFEQFLSAKL